MAHPSDVQHARIAELVPGLDRLAVDAMADWKVPGAALAVVQDGELVLAKAYGHREVEADSPVWGYLASHIGVESTLLISGAFLILSGAWTLDADAPRWRPSS